MKIKNYERIDDLQYKGLKIIQDPNSFCFGIDSIMLANFVKKAKKDCKIVDLGTGSGVLGLLLCKKIEPSKVIGVEIQNEVADMAQRSIEMNNLQSKFEIINEDIKNIIDKKIIEKNSIDIVVTNPPYKEIENGAKNTNMKKLISRHETTAKLSDFIEIAAKLLKDKGSFYIVNKTERISDIIFEMKKNKIEPKEIKLIQPHINSEPNLVLIKGVKCGRSFLKVDKTLIVYNKDGSYTDELNKIYNAK